MFMHIAYTLIEPRVNLGYFTLQYLTVA